MCQYIGQVILLSEGVELLSNQIKGGMEEVRYLEICQYRDFEAYVAENLVDFSLNGRQYQVRSRPHVER